MTTIHPLKCLSQHFEAVMHRRKRAEIRRNDRDFDEFDVLALLEVTHYGAFTGRVMYCRIMHVLQGVDGLESGHAMLSLGRPKFTKVEPDDAKSFHARGSFRAPAQPFSMADADWL